MLNGLNSQLARLSAGEIVARVGFEPTTFRL